MTVRGFAVPIVLLVMLVGVAPGAVEDPDFKATMDKIEVAVVFKPGEEFQRFFEADAARLIETVRRIGLTEPK
jgi:tripartite-type tricarboxylate transporter receptor subunit TctC